MGYPRPPIFRGPLDNLGECLKTLNKFFKLPVPALNPSGQIRYQKLNPQNIYSALF